MKKLSKSLIILCVLLCVLMAQVFSGMSYKAFAKVPSASRFDGIKIPEKGEPILDDQGNVMKDQNGDPLVAYECYNEKEEVVEPQGWEMVVELWEYERIMDEESHKEYVIPKNNDTEYVQKKIDYEYILEDVHRQVVEDKEYPINEFSNVLTSERAKEIAEKAGLDPTNYDVSNFFLDYLIAVDVKEMKTLNLINEKNNYLVVTFLFDIKKDDPTPIFLYDCNDSGNWVEAPVEEQGDGYCKVRFDSLCPVMVVNLGDFQNPDWKDEWDWYMMDYTNLLWVLIVVLGLSTVALSVLFVLLSKKLS